jgi:RNA polymerase sigma factor (sigma-70 family)
VEPETKDDAESMILFKQVLSKLDTLDVIYRDPLWMRYAEDLPVKEIARILKLSENVISVRIHRGLAQLRKVFNP